MLHRGGFRGNSGGGNGREILGNYNLKNKNKYLKNMNMSVATLLSLCH